jgi:dihydroxyacetone kinase-like predicted kinase
MVTYEPNGVDARGVEYGRLTALVIEAIKEQQQEISELRGRLARIEQSPPAR